MIHKILKSAIPFFVFTNTARRITALTDNEMKYSFMRSIGKSICENIRNSAKKSDNRLDIKVMERYSEADTRLGEMFEKSKPSISFPHISCVAFKINSALPNAKIDEILLITHYKLFLSRFRKLLEVSGFKAESMKQNTPSETVDKFLQSVSSKLSPDEMLHYSRREKEEYQGELGDLADALGLTDYTLLEDKPMSGFYYSTPWSDPDSWLRYQFILHGDTFKFDLSLFSAVKVPTDDSVLRLRTTDEIKSFEKEYGESYLDGLAISINWTKVKEKYKGIEIIPFHSDLAITSDWYAEWDCSTGVLWDEELIKKSTRELT